jgi:hypothetical protein
VVIEGRWCCAFPDGSHAVAALPDFSRVSFVGRGRAGNGDAGRENVVGIVVPDGVAGAEANPLGDGPVLLARLGQLHLGAESLVALQIVTLAFVRWLLSRRHRRHLGRRCIAESPPLPKHFPLLFLLRRRQRAKGRPWAKATFWESGTEISIDSFDEEGCDIPA